MPVLAVGMHGPERRLEKLEREKRWRAKTHQALRPIVHQAWRCLQCWVRGNRRNQSALFERLDHVRAEMDAHPSLGIEGVVVEIFRDNARNIERCPPELYRSFARLLNEHHDKAAKSQSAGERAEAASEVSGAAARRDLKYLEFFEVMLETRAEGTSYHAQRIIVDALVDADPGCELALAQLDADVGGGALGAAGASLRALKDAAEAACSLCLLYTSPSPRD